MGLDPLFGDKSFKPSEKTMLISQWLLEGNLTNEELLEYAGQSKDSVKATCIEAFEFATKIRPQVADERVLDFVISEMGSKAPRIQWESAKVIGRVAHLFPHRLEELIRVLLKHTDSDGTVVRWSIAFALGEILQLNSPHNAHLVPAVERICDQEEKSSIQKIYRAALKKIRTV